MTGWRGRIVPASELAELLAGLTERGLLPRCDAVLSGYLGDEGTADVVRAAVARVRAANPAALYCCDPVMGEVGRGVYVRPGLPARIAERLVPQADLVTPNPFELERLTGLIASQEGRLANPQFLTRAPEAVVARERDKLAQWQDQAAALRQKREQLGCEG